MLRHTRRWIIKSGICADDTPTTTATGTMPRHGVIAVDPKEIPYGTEVLVPGYGRAVAEDTGGMIRNYRSGVAIDICVSSYEEAMAWGVQYVTIYVKKRVEVR